MPTPRLSDPTSNSRTSSLADAQVTLVVNLTAAPSARLTHEISSVLNRLYDQPYTFLGSVGDSLDLDLHLSDPGLVATEILVRRLLKISGVKKIKAERVCCRRGPLYGISLKAFA